MSGSNGVHYKRHIRERAKSLGVSIIPKSLAPFVPLSIEHSRKLFDAILIDNDPLIHDVWMMAAKDHNKQVKCFLLPEEFIAEADRFDLRSPLFIDVSLDNGIRGEQVAVEAAKLGFSEIRLATGYEAGAITRPSCVIEVVGKAPKFIEVPA